MQSSSRFSFSDLWSLLLNSSTCPQAFCGVGTFCKFIISTLSFWLSALSSISLCARFVNLPQTFYGVGTSCYSIFIILWTVIEITVSPAIVRHDKICHICFKISNASSTTMQVHELLKLKDFMSSTSAVLGNRIISHRRRGVTCIFNDVLLYKLPSILIGGPCNLQPSFAIL